MVASLSNLLSFMYYIQTRSSLKKCSLHFLWLNGNSQQNFPELWPFCPIHANVSYCKLTWIEQNEDRRCEQSGHPQQSVGNHTENWLLGPHLKTAASYDYPHATLTHRADKVPLRLCAVRMCTFNWNTDTYTDTRLH